MVDLTLIKQRNQLIVKTLWIFLFIDISINIFICDFSNVANISIISVPPLLLITYLVKKNIGTKFIMYLITFLFLTALFLLNLIETDYINLFFLILPPVFCMPYRDNKNILFASIGSAVIYFYFFFQKGEIYFVQWEESDIIYILFFFLAYAAIKIYESRFLEGIHNKLKEELDRVKRLQSKLHESEERYRAMVKQSSDGIFAFHPKDKSIVETNERFCEMLGYEEHELLKLSLKDIIASDESIVDRNIGNILKQGWYMVGEKRYRHKDGSVIFVEVSGSTIHFHNEMLILANIRDVTKQKETERALKENEQHLRQIYENMTDMVIKTDQHYQIQYASPSCETIIGYDVNELMSHPIFDYIQKNGISSQSQSNKESKPSLTGRFVFRHRHRNGKLIWLEATGDELFDDNGNKIGAIFVCRDITDRVIMEEKIRQTTASLETIISHIHYGILAVDKENRIILLNQQFGDVFQIPSFSSGQYLGMDHIEFFRIGRQAFVIGHLIENSIKEIFDSRKMVLDEEWELKNGCIISRDAIPIFTNGEFAGFLWQFRDMTQRKIVEKELKQASLVDGLTKIFNRRFFDEMLAKEWRRGARTSKPLTLIMLDIDCFKKFNDTYGHLVGDDCLIRVAQTIRDTLRRPSDIGCRYGGEEFAVILPETNLAGGLKLAEKIREAIEGLMIPHSTSKISRYITCSLGVATITPSPSITPEEIIKKADIALYTSKTNGRNRVST